MEKLRDMFEDRYMSTNHKHRLRLNFLGFEQGRRTVGQYTAMFYELSLFTQRIAEDEDDIRPFMCRVFATIFFSLCQLQMSV